MGVRRMVVAAWAAVCMVACGGGADEPSSGDEPPAATPPAEPANLGMPPRLALLEGGSGGFAAVGASGAVAWSSSNPAAVTVDADGRIAALAKGTATITASAGAQSGSTAVSVYREADDPTSGALIAAARTAGRIDDEQALLYRVYAHFGDPRLPSEFEGAPLSTPDHLLLREVAGRLPALSASTQALLRPFLLPPIYAGSRLAAASAGAPASQRERAKQTVNCERSSAAFFYATRTTAHFNIHYTTLHAGQAKAAELVASMIEEIYASLTGALGRFPASDAGENCNGGDGAIDIYLQANWFSASSTPAMTVAYPGRCENVPAFIVAESGLAGALGGYALGIDNDDLVRQVKAMLAHELTHVIQFGVDRARDCADYKWFDEAMAQWATDHVDPTFDQYEDGHLTASGFSGEEHTGPFFLQNLLDEHRVSIEVSPDDKTAPSNGYADYLFFQYLARRFGAATMGELLAGTASDGSVEAIANALRGRADGGLKSIWPEFARTLWNHHQEQRLDYWHVTDRYQRGLVSAFDPDGKLYGLQPLHKPTDIDLKGAQRALWPLFGKAAAFPSGYEFAPRSLQYERVRFVDQNARAVQWVNPIALLPANEFIRVEVLTKINGSWSAVQDWTRESARFWCRDKVAERIEEMIVIVSNSEVNRGSERPYVLPQAVPIQISASNVGCWKWTGSASSSTSVSNAGGDLLASASISDATFELQWATPGRLRLQTSAGQVSARQTGTVGVCSLDVVGSSRQIGIANPPDGVLELSLDLEIGPGMPADRKLVALVGGTRLSSTTTLSCPTGTNTTSGDIFWDWLKLDDPTRFEVSADGLFIRGETTFVDAATGARTSTRWNFVAARE